MVASSLSARPTVELIGGESASGLADLLHQFLEQTLQASAEKAARARGLRGDFVVRAAEDESVAVQIAFLGDRIELRDLGPASLPKAPSLRGDFLSVAHVTSGSASPLGLILRGRLSVRFGPAQLPFLWNVLMLMRIDSGEPRRASGPWLVLAVLVVLALAALLFARRF